MRRDWCESEEHLQEKAGAWETCEDAGTQGKGASQCSVPPVNNRKQKGAGFREKVVWVWMWLMQFFPISDVHEMTRVWAENLGKNRLMVSF